MDSKAVLVTGGAGYIGAHTCKALHQAGFVPVTYDNLSTGHREAVKWGPLEQGDIADTTRLLDTMQRHDVSALVHFAAHSDVARSVREPLDYYANNVSGSTALFAAAVEHGIRHIVFSSTCATYGMPQEMPIREDCPQQPINPYGRSKWMVERILDDVCQAHGIAGMALRYFNAAGADPDGEIGEDHDPETHLIPLVLRALGRNDNPVRIFGTDYDTPDGTCIRDYIHVNDLAKAHVLALQKMMEGSLKGFNALNLGTGTGLSVRAVADGAQKLTKLPLTVVEAGRRAGDPPVLVAGADRAAQVLGWKPVVSDLDTILSTAWAWEKNRP